MQTRKDIEKVTAWATSTTREKAILAVLLDIRDLLQELSAKKH